MKSELSKEFYLKNWDRFIEEVPGDHYRNLEKELETIMNRYKGVEILEKNWEIVRKVEAKKIADSCKELCLKDMQIIKDLDSGVSSFGMTTRTQEINKRYEFKRRWEFNCLQLALFREKYGV